MKNWRFTDKVMFAMCIVLLMLLALVATGHTTTTAKQPNAIGSVAYTSNPFIYEAVLSIAEVGNVDGNLNLRVKPIGTYMLYDDTILICGMPVEKFEGKQEPFVMTYERRAHRSVSGIGCHELVRVDQITPSKGQF